MAVGTVAVLLGTAVALRPMWGLAHAPLALGAIALTPAFVGAVWGVGSAGTRAPRAG